MINILVVDDEVDILETIVDTLEMEFDEKDVLIHKALNGIEALKILETTNETFTLVVTDLNMPEMDGIELTQNLNTKYSDLPVIVFTGHGDLEEQEKLSTLGVKAMVKKPYVEELIKEVSSLINI